MSIIVDIKAVWTKLCKEITGAVLNEAQCNCYGPILRNTSLLHCALAAAQCIVIGAVCWWVCVCVGLLPR